MSEPKIVKSVDVVYEELRTHIDLEAERLSPVARGMLLASLRRHIEQKQRADKNTLFGDAKT